MDALILAAGLGTRLAPITEVLPKALVPVGDKAVAAHALAAVRMVTDAGLVVLNAHHQAEAVRRFCARQDVLCSTETTLLGTAGGLAQARALLGRASDVLVYNADMWAPGVSLAPLIARFAALPGALGALLYRPGTVGEGNLGVDENGRVVRLRQERFGVEHEGGWFLGIHVVGGDVVLPGVGCLVGDVYLPILRTGGVLVAEPYAGEVFDIGTPKALLDANLFWLRGMGGARWVAKSAEVHAEVTESVVHEGARVMAPGRRLLVGPGEVVTEPLEGAVVLGGRVVRT